MPANMAQHVHLHAPLRYGRGEACGHGLHGRDRLIAIDGGDLFADRCGQGERIAVAAHDQDHVRRALAALRIQAP